MRFNPKSQLDTSRVSDAGRGGGGGGGLGSGLGGGGMQLPGGMKAGGGAAGLIVVVLVLVLTSCLGGGGLPGGLTGTGTSGGGLDTSNMVNSDSGRYDNCKTGVDANNSADCARVAIENSLVSYWSKALPEQSGVAFKPATLETFSGSSSTGCGQASAAVGPFYCPPDQRIYLDTSFFQDVLQKQLGGPAGDFVEPYVIAHEYGHHIQNLLGTMSKVKTQQGPRSDSVRLELQADCYAGMWARSATTTDDATGQPLILDLTAQDVAQAQAAAASVGDDKIQQKTQGQVDKETWTHGSAASRQKWFETGYDNGSLKACDTFSVATP